MDINEAKKILNKQGFRVIKERANEDLYNGASSCDWYNIIMKKATEDGFNYTAAEIISYLAVDSDFKYENACNLLNRCLKEEKGA